ncbi:hypothetical protein FRC18_000014 [Serendipita sp. 400]|nr:hypothetical protein FRC18_000014 [Serendipita sp. 400]
MFAAVSLILSALSASTLVLAAPRPISQPALEKKSALPTHWYHKRDHPVHELFRRGPGDDPLPAVGSPEWAANFAGVGQTPENNIPQKWLDALAAAEHAGLIPNFAPALTTDGGLTTSSYPPGTNAGQEPICSSMYQCRHKDDVWDAPANMIGLSVDDGPVSYPTASPRLYDFLKANNQKVTHFMIGANILGNPQMFLRAYEELEDDIAVHTWTHRHMSTLTNRQLVADLGWTLQIIHDSTGGRVPQYWRPPFGDADNRVRAVAMHVFGMTTVIWNQDSQDWTMAAPGGTTLPAIQAAFTRWLNGPRNPGLIVLQHEITADDVTAFINMYPLIAAASEAGRAQGLEPWRVVSVSQLFDGSADGTQGSSEHEGWYQNSWNNTAPVDDVDIIDGGYAASISDASLTASATPTSRAANGTVPGGPTGTTIPTQSVSINSATVGKKGVWATVGLGLAGVFTLVL